MKTRRITLPVVLSVSALLFSACALTRPDEPDAARWPNAMSDSWEATEPNGRNIEVWIIREDGDLSVIEVDGRPGDAARERESWNGSWWTQPDGNGGREICYVARHGRGAWCEEYTLTTDPPVLRFGDQEFRPRSTR
jgi:hypothetical protein